MGVEVGVGVGVAGDDDAGVDMTTEEDDADADAVAHADTLHIYSESQSFPSLPSAESASIINFTRGWLL